MLTGLLAETDYGYGQGIVFVEENVPFEIVTEQGSASFVMQFYELPPFVMDVTKGRLLVRPPDLGPLARTLPAAPESVRTMPRS